MPCPCHLHSSMYLHLVGHLFICFYFLLVYWFTLRALVINVPSAPPAPRTAPCTSTYAPTCRGRSCRTRTSPSTPRSWGPATARTAGASAHTQRWGGMGGCRWCFLQGSPAVQRAWASWPNLQEPIPSHLPLFVRQPLASAALASAALFLSHALSLTPVSPAQVLGYLEAFADFFQLRPLVLTRTRVTGVEPLPPAEAAHGAVGEAEAATTAGQVRCRKPHECQPQGVHTC